VATSVRELRLSVQAAVDTTNQLIVAHEVTNFRHRQVALANIQSSEAHWSRSLELSRPR